MIGKEFNPNFKTSTAQDDVFSLENTVIVVTTTTTTTTVLLCKICKFDLTCIILYYLSYSNKKQTLALLRSSSQLLFNYFSLLKMRFPFAFTPQIHPSRRGRFWEKVVHSKLSYVHIRSERSPDHYPKPTSITF